MLSLKWLLDFPVEMLNKQLDTLSGGWEDLNWRYRCKDGS